MDKQIRIVTATTLSSEEFWATATLAKSMPFWEDPNDPIVIDVIERNSTGLPELYNRYLDEKYKGQIVLFVHDDVSIQDAMFQNKLRTAHESYDVVGLAGGDNAVEDPELLLWHVMSRSKSGIVAHPTKDGSSVNSVCFGPTPSPVELLDGLFISVDIDAALDRGYRWDEDFNFHFYDLSFSLTVSEKGGTMGTWPIWVVHSGLGDSYQSDAWKKQQPTFKSKYRPRIRNKKALF